jgi:sarcosine oxidase subunit alpha
MFRRLFDTPGTIAISIDGKPHRTAPGDTVAVALLTAGVAAFRVTARLDQPRGPYCGMGVCFDCLVTIDNVPNRQACLVPVRDGMSIETGRNLPNLVEGASA